MWCVPWLHALRCCLSLLSYFAWLLLCVSKLLRNQCYRTSQIYQREDGSNCSSELQKAWVRQIWWNQLLKRLISVERALPRTRRHPERNWKAGNLLRAVYFVRCAWYALDASLSYACVIVFWFSRRVNVLGANGSFVFIIISCQRFIRTGIKCLLIGVTIVVTIDVRCSFNWSKNDDMTVENLVCSFRRSCTSCEKSVQVSRVHFLESTLDTAA